MAQGGQETVAAQPGTWTETHGGHTLPGWEGLTDSPFIEHSTPFTLNGKKETLVS